MKLRVVHKLGDGTAGIRFGRVAGLLRRVPSAGRWCFLVAFLNILIWTFVIPPFQVPDEISHFAYVQYVAEVGRPPPQGAVSQYSPQEQDALNALSFTVVAGHAAQRGIMNAIEEEGLREQLAATASPIGEGGSSSATDQPPLYYALEAVPYLLSPSQQILARLEWMRVLSALMAALTVLCIYMFLRELLPGSPWAWTVGALVVAFQPMFCFIGAGVQGDNLLFLASAATFLGLARAFRRGLTYRRAALIGLAIAAGVLGKLTFIALLPGIALALVLLGWRAWPSGRGQALGAVTVATAIVAIPALAYAILNTSVWHRGGLTAGGVAGATTNASAVGHIINFRETLDYIWQLYLPRLPFMHREFSYRPLITTWLDGTVGQFGWLDYTFPQWVYTVAHWLFRGFGILALVGIVRMRRAIRPWLGILACFAVMAVGLLGAIGDAGIHYRATTNDVFEQARYLFPLLAFYGLFMVVTAKGMGRRWAPVLGGVLVVLAMAHGLFAETLTISRYYG